LAHEGRLIQNYIYTECGRETGDYKTKVINSYTVFTKL